MALKVEQNQQIREDTTSGRLRGAEAIENKITSIDQFTKLFQKVLNTWIEFFLQKFYEQVNISRLILLHTGDPCRAAHRKRSCQGAFFVQTSYFRGAGTIGSNVEVLCLMLLHKNGFKGSSKMSCKKKSFVTTLILLQLSTSQQSIIAQIVTKFT